MNRAHPMPSTGHKLFLAQLQQSPLGELLRPYDAPSRVRAFLELPARGIMAGAETFVAASANIESGPTTRIPNEVLLSAVKECDKLTLRVPPKRPYLVGHLRTIRGLRPPWLTGPIYSEILGPFASEIEEITGLNPSGVFDLLLKVSHLMPGAEPPIEILRRLPNSLLIEYDHIREPADFRDRAFLKVENLLFPLVYQMADATYRALCAELGRRLPKFFDRKGDSLERLTRALLAHHAPGWTWIPNFDTPPVSRQEHDLIGFRENYGFAVECKSLNLRPSSMDWSTLNALSDAAPLIEGLDQVSPSIRLLKTGGSVVTVEGSRQVPAVSWAHGLIVTDEVFTPYLRAFLDPPNPEGSVDLPPTGWHGATVMIVSIIDLQFLLQASGTFPLFLEFTDWISKRPRMRAVDTPESWLLYCIDPTIRLTAEGGQLSAEYDELWDKLEGRELSELRPPWHSHHTKVAASDQVGRVRSAIQTIRRDREIAQRRFPSDVQLRALSPFWRDNLDLTRRDHWRIRVRTGGSPPLEN